MITKTRRHTHAPAFTPESARSFDSFSLANAALAVSELTARGVCDGTCQPYTDILTYRRWQALGMQVKRGEHGVHLSVFVKSETTDEDGTVSTRRFPTGTTVFCRHQVKEA